MKLVLQWLRIIFGSPMSRNFIYGTKQFEDAMLRTKEQRIRGNRRTEEQKNRVKKNRIRKPDSCSF